MPDKEVYSRQIGLYRAEIDEAKYLVATIQPPLREDQPLVLSDLQIEPLVSPVINNIQIAVFCRQSFGMNEVQTSGSYREKDFKNLFAKFAENLGKTAITDEILDFKYDIAPILPKTSSAHKYVAV
ncbi:MAG: hypothetical protein NVS1B10_04060 [Candidatus Saccharimonadales bacterium]